MIFGRNADCFQNRLKFSTKLEANKLGLSWAKLSHQLGLGCSSIKICCIIGIILGSMTATNQ